VYGVSRIASVILPLPLPEAFDYAEPEGMGLSIGDQVVVPLGPRMSVGVVSGLREAAGGNRPLKPVVEKRDAPALPPGSMKFVEWAARYCVDVPGWPLAMTLRGAHGPKAKPEKLVAATGAAPSKITPARARVMAAATEPLAGAELARRAGVSSGVIKGLIDDGALEIRVIEPDHRFAQPDPSRPSARLNPSQAAAAKALTAMTAEGFQTALLDGVTGSGKTEVYLETIAALLTRDPAAQVLVLLPEIALTQAVIARFEDRFGAAPAEWHSAVPPLERRRVWEGAVSGDVRIVVGARSALFLPFSNLKLIVVDEEHDSSFKQSEGFVYHARDLAVVRAKIENASVILASATPSLESLANAQAGRYRWLRLADRFGGASLPDVTLIDMRAAPPEPGHWISPQLAQAMAEVYGRGEQSLLFLNRRGYAPLVICRSCG